MKVGQKVVCISDYDYPERWEDLPQKDKTYTIREVETYKGGTYLRFNEIINQPRQYVEVYYEIIFDKVDFRPLDFAFVELVLEMIIEEELTI